MSEGAKAPLAPLGGSPLTSRSGVSAIKYVARNNAYYLQHCWNIFQLQNYHGVADIWAHVYDEEWDQLSIPHIVQELKTLMNRLSQAPFDMVESESANVWCKSKYLVSNASSGEGDSSQLLIAATRAWAQLFQKYLFGNVNGPFAPATYSVPSPPENIFAAVMSCIQLWKDPSAV